jgi:hypothetical protein
MKNMPLVKLYGNTRYEVKFTNCQTCQPWHSIFRLSTSWLCRVAPKVCCRVSLEDLCAGRKPIPALFLFRFPVTRGTAAAYNTNATLPAPNSRALCQQPWLPPCSPAWRHPRARCLRCSSYDTPGWHARPPRSPSTQTKHMQMREGSKHSSWHLVSHSCSTLVNPLTRGRHFLPMFCCCVGVSAAPDVTHDSCFMGCALGVLLAVQGSTWQTLQSLHYLTGSSAFGCYCSAPTSSWFSNFDTCTACSYCV